MKEMFDQALSYLNNDNATMKAPDDLIKSGKDYLKENPLPSKIELLSPEQATIYSFLHNEFIKSTPVIENHLCWHDQNGFGGRQGAESGEKFVSFHRNMIKDFANFIDQPTSSIPTSETNLAGVADLLPLPTGVTLEPVASIDTSTPSYLTAQGGTEVVSMDCREIRSLNDLNSIDDFGRVLGENYHAAGHQALGGTMIGFESPRAAIFYSWHWHLDKLADRFLETEQGQSWLQSDNATKWNENTAMANSTTFSATCDASLPSTPDISPASCGREEKTKGIIIGTSVAGGAALLLGMAAALYVRKKMSARSGSPQQQDTRQEPDVESNDNPSQQGFASKLKKKNPNNPSAFKDGDGDSIQR